MPDFASDWLSLLIHEVELQTGIVIRDRDRTIFTGKLEERVRTRRYATLDDYCQWLLAKTHEIHDRTTARGTEWQYLIQRISVTESYFFRDQGQFLLLRQQILPRLIAERRHRAQVSGKRPRLRLWSAASSTGEEAYSLAILLWELLPDLHNWDLHIIGTDINEAALASARRAVYNDWSFRQVDPALRARYFTLQSNRIDRSWKLEPQIANLVSFHALNLSRVSEYEIARELNDLDLILCRNVFIYLNSATIDGTLKRMAQALNSFGYLLTAHAELQHRKDNLFKAQLCPQSMVYQRCDSPSPLLAEATASPIGHAVSKHTTPRASANLSRSPRPVRAVEPPVPKAIASLKQPYSSPRVTDSPRKTPRPADIARRTAIQAANTTQRRQQPARTTSTSHTPASHLRASEPASGQMQEAIALFHGQDYIATIDLLDRLLTQNPKHFQACDLLSLAYANLGQYNQASYYCSKALEIDVCATSPYYLLAHLAENSGNIARAKTFLKRIVYLDPEAALAYLELAALYRTERDFQRAARMIRTARILLSARDPNEILDPYRQLSVSSVLKQIGSSPHSSPVSPTCDRD